MSRHDFGPFSVVLPPGWHDITESIDVDDPPFILAREHGVGTLQFTIPLIDEGAEVPDLTSDDLAAMLADFAASRDFGVPTDFILESAPLRIASGNFAPDGEFLRVWYLSDGPNLAFITHDCESGRDDDELDECERIVRSLRFGPSTPRDES